MIRTKNVYMPRGELDGRRILITRYYPRGVKKSHFDEWCRDLSPSTTLLKQYRNGEVPWNDFMIQFKKEIDSDRSLEIIDRLHTECLYSNITLLCYERDGDPCHRHLLQKIIAKPQMLRVDFVPEYTDDHEGSSVTRLISHQESVIIP